jgi:hypothetical protein
MRPDGAEFFMLEVKDTGIGIKPEDTKRPFVEFQLLDSSTSKRYQGTGLGLALIKRIVEAQGGTVGVRSEPGEGSTFFARLPRIPEVAPSEMSGAVALTSSDFDPSRHSILVIEDDVRDRGWLLATLNGAGYPVEAAANGAEAIRMMDSRRFDAVTLDVLLPDLSGWGILRHIREKRVTVTCRS